MKTSKIKETKKQKAKVKNETEIDLTAKLKAFVISLGHDAEDIGVEIKKASKLLSKKLASKLKNLKKSSEQKIKDTKADLKKVSKITKKEAEKVKKEVAKANKSAGKKLNEVKKAVKKDLAPVVKQVTSIKSLAADLTLPAKAAVKKTTSIVKSAVSKATVATKTTAAKAPAKKVRVITKTVAAKSPSITTAKRPVAAKAPVVSNKVEDSQDHKTEHSKNPLSDSHQDVSASPTPKSDPKPNNSDLPK
jgi:hypothetical protein